MPTDLDEEETRIKNMYWKDKNAQMLLRSLVRLGGGEMPGPYAPPVVGGGKIEHDSDYPIEIEDIVDDMALMEAEGPLKKQALGRLLRKFVDQALIKKVKKGWVVSKGNLARLLNFVDDDEGSTEIDLTEDDDDEDDDLSDYNIIDLSLDEVKSSPLSAFKTASSSSGTKLNPISIDTDEESLSSLSASITRNKDVCVNPAQSSRSSRVTASTGEPETKKRKLSGQQL